VNAICRPSRFQAGVVALPSSVPRLKSPSVNCLALPPADDTTHNCQGATASVNRKWPSVTSNTLLWAAIAVALCGGSCATNAMLFPSGLQEYSSTPCRLSVTRRVPRRFIDVTKIWTFLLRASFAKNARRVPSGDQRGEDRLSRLRINVCRAALATSTRSIRCAAASVFQSGVDTMTAISLPSGEICGSLKDTILRRSLKRKAGDAGPTDQASKQAIPNSALPAILMAGPAK